MREVSGSEPGLGCVQAFHETAELNMPLSFLLSIRRV
jgi:hypothetical protein